MSIPRSFVRLVARGAATLAVLVGGCAAPQKAPPAAGPGPAPAPPIVLRTEHERALYAFGVLLGAKLAPLAPSTREREVLEAAIADEVAGRAPALGKDALAYAPQASALARAAAEAPGSPEARDPGVAYLEGAARRPGARLLPSGAIMRTETPGAGGSPAPTDHVTIVYEEKLVDGTVVGSNRREDRESVTYSLPKVIPCLRDALQLMRSGEKVQLVCPPATAFGSCAQPSVPANSTIVYDLTLLSFSPTPLDERTDDAVVHDVAPGAAPLRGGPHAKVTLVMFADFQCPFSRRADVTVSELLERYGDDLALSYRYRLMPFHRNAEPAALAAEAARAQGKFWEMHDKMFANQQALERADLERYAQEIGLDLPRFKAALDAGQGKEQIQRDEAAAKKLHVVGIPVTFINGRRLDGAQPPERFMQIIDDELRKAGGSQKTHAP